MGWTRTESDDNEMTWSEEGNLVCRRIAFTETAGAGVYTGTVAIPAGGVICVAEWETTAAWAGSAVIDLGYTGSLSEWETANAAVDGVAAAYHVWPNGASSVYFAAGTTVVAVITSTGAGGTTGRSIVTISYSVPPTATAATKA